MKRLMVWTMLMVLCGFTAVAADVAGKWVAQVPGRDGTPMDYTFVFKVDGAKVSGTLTMNMMGEPMEQPISDGKLEGSNISFVTVMKFQEMEMKSSWKGTVAGAEMKLTRTREGGMGGPGGPGGAGGPGAGGGAGGAGGPGGGRGPGGAQEIVAKKVG